ncbi:hypothetical protein NC651_017354 [Populus alba x Populus x berolinensis]|nr:hypothetical protein NC651_017354 [Populus alba x Populus x berolinensis]
MEKSVHTNADINTFRDLVQKLTGLASDTQRLPVTRALSSSKPSRNPVDLTGPRRSPFKLQERRHTLRKLEIKLGLTSLSNSSSSPTRQTHRLDSPVTPLCSGFLFFPSPGTESPSSPAVLEEEKAIAEKGFYFHPSPLNTARGSEPPELLTLFPLSSPSQSGGNQTDSFYLPFFSQAADINTFRDLVQKLTGLASDTQRLPVRRPLSSSKPSRNPVDFTAPRRSPFKLQERRHTLRKLEIELGLISLSNSSSSSTRQTHRLDSPVTPLCSEFLFFPSPGTESPSSPAVSEEEKAIAEKGFYFHPSPLNTPRGSEPPELLALFPLISSSQSNQD